MFKKLSFLFLTILLSFTTSIQLFGQCDIDTEWSFDPPLPPSGAYEEGTVVTICAEITQYSSGGANWISGIVLVLPDAWDQTTISNITGPTNPCNQFSGEWIYLPELDCNGFDIDDPGFYFDSPVAGPFDGDPCNNWGDGSVACPNWEICFDITLDVDCGGPSNPFDGTDVTPNIQVYSDSEIGSWGVGTGCAGTEFEDPPGINIELDCCDANSGTPPAGPVDICGNTPFDLFSLLGAPVDLGGTWAGPPGWTPPPAGVESPATFTPSNISIALSDPAGDYTYTTIGTDGCLAVSTITMEFIDLGLQSTNSLCTSAPEPLLSLWLNPVITLPPGGTWFFEDGTEIIGGTVDPLVNVSGIYTYVYQDAGGCLTTISMQLNIAPGGGAGFPSTTLDICVLDDPMTPWDSLLGVPASLSGDWLYYNSGNALEQAYLTGSPVSLVLDPGDYDGLGTDMVPGYLVYFSLDPACGFSQDTLFLNVGDPFDAGDFTTTSICENDPPLLLESLLGGTPDAGGVWTDATTGAVLPNPFDPSTVAANTTYTYLYNGGLAGTLCAANQILQLTVLSSVTDAGDPGVVTVCETAPSFNMTDTLPGSPQPGGTWTDPLGNPLGGEFFVPGTNIPGTYTYTINSPCGSDTNTLTINVNSLADGGIDGTLDICPADVNVPLVNGLGGTPDPGGFWTLGVTPVGATVSGATVNNGDVYTYNVGTGTCATTSEVTINLQPAPTAGVLTTAPQIYCSTDAAFSLNTLFTVAPSSVGDFWTDPFGNQVTGSILNPLTANSGTYTYSVTNSCGTVFNTISISIEAAPFAGTSTTFGYCDNATAPQNLFTLLGGGVTTGGTWTGPSGVSSGIFNSGDPAGVYTYSVLSSPTGICSATATVTVSYTPVANAGTNTVLDICDNETATIILFNELEGNPDPGGTWFPFSAYTPGVTNPADVTSYTITNPGCNPSFATMSFNIVPAPDPGLNTSVQLCESLGIIDLTSYLNGTPVPGGTWSNAITGAPVANPFNMTGQCGTTLQLEYSVTAGACSDVSTLTLEIQCLPDAGIDVTLDYCADNSVLNLNTILDPSADAGGQFLSPLGIAVPGNIITLTSAASGNYTYIADGDQCASDVAVYTINIADPIGVFTDAQCTPSQTTYVVTLTLNGGTPPYTVSGIPGPPAVGNIFVSDPILVGTPFSFTVSDAGPCPDFVLPVTAGPNCVCPADVEFVPTPQNICEGETADLSLIFPGGAGPFTIDYTDGTNVFTNVGPLVSLDVLQVSPTVTTNYTITAVSDINCTSTVSEVIAVNVEQAPNAGPDVALDYCGTGGLISLPSITDPGADPFGTFTNSVGTSVINVPQLAVASDVYTYTVTGTVCPPDQALYNIGIDEPLVVNAVTATCNPSQTTYVVTFEISGGDGNYSVTGLTGSLNTSVTPAVFTSVDIPTGTPYSYTVSDGGPCPDVVAGPIPSPNCTCPATAAFLDPSVVICEGETAFLSLSFPSGADPFFIDYNDGTNTFTNVGPFSDGDLLTVVPTATTTYTLTAVTDANCTTSITDQIVVTLEPQPNAGPDVALDFCGTGGLLALSTIIDGTADQTGTFFSPSTGAPVTSIPLTAASSGIYTYEVMGTQCPEDFAFYDITIFEQLSANVVSAVCDPSQTSYIVTCEIPGGDGNYVVTGLNGVINTSVSPAVFTSDPIPTGTPYSFTVSDGSPCPDVVIGPFASPNCSCPATASFVDPSVTICEGATANLELEFSTGAPPFSIDYTDGTNTFTNVGPFFSGDFLTVNPLTTTTYTITAVTDANCNTSVSDQITVNVEPLPNAGPDVTQDFCGTGGFISLTTLIDPSADQTGTFTDGLGNVVTNIPQQASSAGVYTYTVAGTECPDDQALYTINIDEPLTVTVASALCDPSQTFYVVVLEISGGDGNYNVTGMTGSLNSLVTPAIFTSDNISTGTPYSYTVSDGGPCNDVSAGPIASPNCACPATAAFADFSASVCEGSSANLTLEFLSGTDPFFIDYTDGTNTFTNVGPFSNGNALTVNPTTSTTYTITGVTDANCSTSASSSITVNVETAPNAGPDVTEQYCTTNGPLNLLSLVDGAVADLGGSFLDPLGMQVTGNTINQNAASSGVYTYQVTGVECPPDQASYNIIINDEITANNVQAVCNQSQTGYIVSFEIIGGDGAYIVTPGGPYGGTIIPGPTVTYESGLIPNGTNYNFTISDGSACLDEVVAGVDPDCDCPAAGSISGTQSICSGNSATLTFTFQGDGPWDAIVENSEDPFNPIILTDVDNGHLITVTPLVTTTYTMTSVNDVNCTGFATGSPVTVTVDAPLVVTPAVETCDIVNENYTVEFTVSGGVAGTYQVTPTGASFNAGQFVSNPIQSGENYSFTVSDFGACPDVTVDGFFQCACITEAGSIQSGLIEICDGEILTVPFNNDDVLDGNDSYQFALHSGDENTIGDIIQLYNTSTITIPDNIIFGQTYYITGVAGNTDFVGNVDLNDDCTDQTNGIPVVFNALSSAFLSGTGTVCPGEVVNLNIALAGEGPWNIQYTIDNVPQAPITTNDENYLLTTATPGTYALTSVSDVNCTGSATGIVEVSNFATPTAVLGGNPEVCENSGDGPTVTLTGSAPWTVFYSIGGVEVSSPITTFSDEITIPAQEDGLYAITAVSDANCVGTFSGVLNVSIVPTPSATITGGGSVCEGDVAPFQVSLTGEGPWEFIYTIGGVPQTSVNTVSPFYTFNSGTNGDYVVTQVTDQNCVGTGTASEASLTVNPLPTADIIASSDQICVGQELELIYDLQGTPPFNFTYVLDDDTITLENIQTDLVQVSQPTEPVFTEVLFIEDSSNPSCSNTLNSSKFVGVGTLPDAPVLTSDTICSYADSVNIGVIAAPGLEYSWSPTSRLSDPNSSNPAFVLGNDDFIPVVREYTYVLTASNGECSDSDTLTITVDPGPIANFRFSPNPVNSEDTKVRFTNTSTLGSDGVYFWQFDSLDTSQEMNPFYEFPGGVVADYNISLLAIDPITGCMDEHTDVVSIRPEMLVYVPTAFTPDGDGLNDLWRPVMSNIDGDDFLLTVFDRNGQVVFQTADATQAWNGSHTNGEYFLRTEVYVWKIETRNPISLEEVEYSGTVTVIR